MNFSDSTRIPKSLSPSAETPNPHIENQLSGQAERSEVVIHREWSEGWQAHMPVTLITYENGKQDVHCQTGDHWTKAMMKAAEILAERGLVMDNKTESIMPTGVYFSVRSLSPDFASPTASEFQEKDVAHPASQDSYGG